MKLCLIHKQEDAELGKRLFDELNKQKRIHKVLTFKRKKKQWTVR